MERTSRDNEFIEKHMNTLAYYGKPNQKVAALNVWANSFEILCKATIYKDFEMFKTMEYSETVPPPIKTIMHFVHEKIVDDLRIITCFENFMKGVLILNDVVVHQISNKHPVIRKQQRDRPIMVSEIFTSDSFNHFDSANPDSWETTFQTVNFSWMLKPTYQTIIRLPADILATITKINNDRNRVHFMASKGFQMGKHITVMYENLFEFANIIIRRSVMDLNANLKTLKNDDGNIQP